MKSLMSILLAFGFGLSGFAADEKKDEKKEDAKPAATEPAKGKRKAVDPEEAFKKMDTNSDGKLSLDEFKAGKKDASAAEDRFKKLDKNGDGSLTKDEAFNTHARISDYWCHLHRLHAPSRQPGSNQP